ncbi:hypothetical protein [Psychroserpens sp. NJDZ02]|uniref:hypothetical protein n=1 Tax=Psychroserpens sp. NJDZ02 TaxID=2570561 RepID=UPI0010A92EE3|nr:hypothetical protein [Psychroserpens sp. NJDZ02]QCE42315.1 hypothetical protein E9099_13190 [Psychroserpens sp. NJDZ02]
MESLRNNKLYNLFTGLLLLGFGSYRLYQHFTANPTLDTFRLIISVASIGYGVYALYNYTQLKKQD